MTDQGKYHSQRLKSKDVLRLYAAGERDFRGAILRGCSFHGADLSGADFSGADARHTKFINTNLEKVSFCRARLEPMPQWRIIQLLLACFSSLLIFVFESFLIFFFSGWALIFTIEKTLLDIGLKAFGMVALLLFNSSFLIYFAFLARKEKKFLAKAFFIVITFAFAVAVTGLLGKSIEIAFILVGFTVAFTLAIGAANSVKIGDVDYRAIVESLSCAGTFSIMTFLAGY